MSKSCKCNSGVCCNVRVCKHNINGCLCELETIEVTKGDGKTLHYCGSYKCKEKC
ncbi:MAG: DUF1540 domain-containing protein [Clostridiales bacterium]|nr:DUF1540 domain-containing protein [Clostridiales bacterium]